MRRSRVAAAAAFTYLGFFTSPALAVECGDVITTDTTLTADVGPCTSATDPALTVVGATLDMAGKSLRCDADSPAVGILLDGNASTLANGAVRGCGTDGGVVLGGTGKHQVAAVVSRDGSGEGFKVLPGSDKSKIRKSTALRTGGVGFEVKADSILLDQCTATQCLSTGFTFFPGTSGGRILHCSSTASEFGSGYAISGTNHTIRDSIASGNFSGLLLNGTNLRASKNYIVGNTNAGLVAPGLIEPGSASIRKNVVLGNSNGVDPTLPDILESDGCTGVTYSKNTFGLATDGSSIEPCVE